MEDFEFKIGDMGLAKGHSGESLERATFCGSPLYMAPEVLLRRSYNRQADIWSLGVLIHRLATGKYPLEAANLNELRTKLI